MAKKQGFDAVTIVGVAIALALMFVGQTWMASRRAAQTPPQTQTAVTSASATGTDTGTGTATAVSPAPTDPTKIAATDPKADPKAAPPAEKAPDVDAEPEAAADVTITNEFLKLVFSAKGATLNTVSLQNAYINPADKALGTGLEFLTEIEAGKRAFGLPSFDIGTPEAGKEKERLVYTGPAGAKKSLDNRVWTLASSTGNFDGGDWKIVYTTKLANQYTLTKTFTVPKTGNNVLMDLTVENGSGHAASFQYVLNGPQGLLLDGPKDDPKSGSNAFIRSDLAGRDADEANPEVKSVDAATAAKAVEEKVTSSRPENLWGAVRNRFYMAMLVSLQPKQTIRLTSIPIVYAGTVTDDKRLTEPNVGITAQRFIYPELDDKKAVNDSYAMYLGPNDENRLRAAEESLKLTKPVFMTDVVQYCDLFYMRWPRLDWVARKMMLLFQGIYRLFGSYGVAVILLTLVIKLAMHPMQRNMTISMDKMAKLKPELDKLTAKYKDQTSNEARMKMSMEQRDLYAKAGANPLAGCLPMFVQIPMFSALYGIFNHAFEIRGAEFLWIKDLSQQDHLMSLPFYPHVLNLLPLLYMTVTIISTTYFAPQTKSDDPQQASQQQMMKFMPVLFSFMFYRMPAGLVLYFAANACFGILETWYIRKYVIKSTPGANATPTGNVMAAK